MIDIKLKRYGSQMGFLSLLFFCNLLVFQLVLVGFCLGQSEYTITDFGIANNPNDPDGYDDGLGDGAEVGLGTDPNDPSQTSECPISYYVSPAGHDSNSCLFPGTPCKTIQHVIDVAYGTGTCPVTIHVAAGTYNEHLVMDSWESLEGGWNSDFTQQWDFENDGLEPDPEYAAIVDGGENGTCITQLEVSGANINGLTLQNGSGVAGGIYFDHVSPTVTNCTIKANHGGGGEYAAGGMYNHYSSPTVVNCSFVENISSWAQQWSACAVCNEHSQAIFVKCSFTGGHHGACDTNLGNGMVNIYSSPIISKCRFEENRSGNYCCGAMVNLNSSPVITSCSFLRNRVAETPGAAMLNHDSTIMIINSEFIGNETDDVSGVGIVIINGSSECTMVNCTFADNRSKYCYGDWGGVVSSGSNSHCIVWNSIFWDNIFFGHDSFSGLMLDIDESSTLEVNHCDIDQDGFAGINGNIRQDPMFIKSGWDDNETPNYPRDDVWVGGDYHLQQGSPCIDAGNNDAPELLDIDFEGDPRIIDGNNDGIVTVDMGADEYRPLSGGGDDGDGGGGGGCFLSIVANGSREAK